MRLEKSRAGEFDSRVSRGSENELASLASDELGSSNGSEGFGSTEKSFVEILRAEGGEGREEVSSRAQHVEKRK